MTQSDAFERFRARRFGPLVAVAAMAAGAGLPRVVSAQTLNFSPGPFASGDPNILGNIDEPSNNGTVSTGGFRLRGWVVDQSAQGWAGVENIHVYRGRAEAGGTFLGLTAPATEGRPDVAAFLQNEFFAASGFTFQVGAGQLPAGTHTLAVYAKTQNRGWWFKEVTVNVSSAAATSAATSTTGTVGSNGQFPNDPVVYILYPGYEDPVQRSGGENAIKGYAADRNATSGTGIAKVEVYLDGPKGQGEFLGNADLGKEHGSGEQFGAQFKMSGWELSKSASTYKAGSHRLWVYATSAVTGKVAVTTVDFRVVD